MTSSMRIFAPSHLKSFVHSFRYVLALVVAMSMLASPVGAVLTSETLVRVAHSANAAMRLAQKQGVQVEVMSAHSEDQRVWANPDGTWTSDLWAGTQFVSDGDVCGW